MLTNFTAENSSDVYLNHTSSDSVLNTLTVNDAGLMSEETYQSAQHVMGRLMYVLQGLGLICNTLNVLVMTRPSMRSPASRYLAAMSAVQLVYIILDASLFILLSGSFTHGVYLGFHVLTYRIQVGIYVLPCLSRLHYILTCLVTTERLLAVMVPLKAKNFSVVRHPVTFIGIALLGTFVAHIPLALKYEVYEVTAGTDTYHRFRYTNVYLRSLDLMNVMGIIIKVCFVYVELLFLVGANTALIAALARHAATRRSLMESKENETVRRRETQMTVTILVSTLVFVLLNLPDVTSSLVAQIIPDRYGRFSPEVHLFNFLGSLGAICYILALSTDFFAYICLSSAYRTTLIHLLTRVWPGKTRISDKSEVPEASKTQFTSVTGSGQYTYLLRLSAHQK